MSSLSRAKRRRLDSDKKFRIFVWGPSQRGFGWRTKRRTLFGRSTLKILENGVGGIFQCAVVHDGDVGEPLVHRCAFLFHGSQGVEVLREGTPVHGEEREVPFEAVDPPVLVKGQVVALSRDSAAAGVSERF